MGFGEANHHAKTCETAPNNIYDSRRQDYIAIFILVVLSVYLFRNHICGKTLWIGDSDRLNTYLNILLQQVRSLKNGELRSWSETMFMGYNTLSMPWTFPNPMTFVLSMFAEENLYWSAGVASAVMLSLSTPGTYLFIREYCHDVFASFVGSVVFIFSTYSMLTLAGNDMTFAVIMHMPILLLIIRKYNSNNIILIIMSLTTVATSLLYFCFLQMAAYVILLGGFYALYRSYSLRSYTPVALYCFAIVVSTTIAFPRIYTVAQDFRQMVRISGEESMLPLMKSHEIFRWFSDGIFGRFFSESVSIGNGTFNLHEGWQISGSPITVYLILFGVIRYCIDCLPIRNSEHRVYIDPDLKFYFCFFILAILCTMMEPFYELLYYLFLKTNFYHARFLIVGLPVVALLASSVLNDMRRKSSPKKLRFYILPLFISVLLIVIIHLMARRIGINERIPIGLETGDKLSFYLGLIRTIIYLDIFGKAPDLYNVIQFKEPFVLAREATKVSISFFCFGILVILNKILAKRFERKYADVIPLIIGFMIILQTFMHADLLINGKQMKTKVPFFGNNRLIANPWEFTPPTTDQLKLVRDKLQTDRFRTALIADRSEMPTYWMSHITHFWQIRSVEGYSMGVPMRLGAIPWNGGPSLRSISFYDVILYPWKVMAILNVKYAIKVTPQLYRNITQADGVKKKMEPEELEIISENPFDVTPRHFFVSSIRPAANPYEASHILFVSGCRDDQMPDVRLQSVVEGINEPMNFDSEGQIEIDYEGDRIHIQVNASEGRRFLVLNERYDPNWRAFADDKELLVFPTNVAMRGLIVPSGLTNIEMKYCPFFKKSSALLFFGIGLMILGSVILYIIILTMRKARYL